MKIKKAVIAAAAPDQSQLPFQSLIDRSGNETTALKLIVEEAIEAGIEELCIIIQQGNRESFAQATSNYKVELIEQDNSNGYADALLRATEFVGDENFLHLVGDHLYLSKNEDGCARQLVEIASRENCAVTAVQPTRESLLPYFGTIGATRIVNESQLFKINRVVEKPTPTEAEQELVVAGLRTGFFLCVSGMHVLPASFLSILQGEFDQGIRHISSALDKLAQQERYLAYQLAGTRFNIGVKYGLLRAQLELALSGRDRDRILSELVEMLAQQSIQDDS